MGLHCRSPKWLKKSPLGELVDAMDGGFVCASDGFRQEDYRWNLWADGGANLIAERRRGARMPSARPTECWRCRNMRIRAILLAAPA